MVTRTLLGKEGGRQKVILQVGRPFYWYLSVRTPLVGKRERHLRVRFFRFERLPRLKVYWLGN